MQNLWQDILYAARGMRKNPLFAATAILTLALGIGGTTAMFTIIRAVLLKPLSYSHPDQLVLVSSGATPARFELTKASARSFSGIGAFTLSEDLTLTGAGEPEVLRGVRVSGNFLDLLGVHPLVGRSFFPAEDTPGAAPVAMISSELWKRRFNQDPLTAGKTVTMAATSYTIIGVLPPRFQFPSSGFDVWITRPAEWSRMAPSSRLLSPFLSVFGRMNPGVTLQQANAEMAVIQHQYAVAHPAMLDAKAKTPELLTLMKEDLVGKVRAILWMLFGAVSFVLLIACANVAGLLLARATGRSREFAVRSALGASRRRLVQQLLAESVLLSAAGGFIGVLLAAWSLRAISLVTAFDLPRVNEIHLDWLVLAFAALLSVGTGIFFGLAPSLSASRPNLIGVLRGTGAAATAAAPTGLISGRGLLVTGQIALSVVLLIGAALMMESVAHLRHVDVGFNPAKLLTASVSLPLSRYDTDLKKATFYQDLMHRVDTLPGVRSATTAWFLPMTGFAGSPVQDIAKPPLPLNERTIATILVVTPDYFRTLDIPLRRGRDFKEQDKEGAPLVAIIDEGFARHFWPAGENPIGKRLLVGFRPKPTEIVGVVASVHQNLENTGWPETFYVAFAQHPQAASMVAVRTSGDPLAFSRTLREQVWAIDRDQPITAIQTMDDLVDQDVGQRRLLEGLLGSFAAVALLLAVIGIYGIISYSVSGRVQELGIRWALGAKQSDILRLVMGQGLVLAIAGIVIGIGGALALTRVMKSVLFGVTASDPATFAGIGLLFVVVALVAAYIPARRATRVDPMTALRI